MKASERHSRLFAALPALLLVLQASAGAETTEGAINETAPKTLVQQSPSPQIAVPFDGTWEGRILFDKEAFLNATATPLEGIAVRIEIHDVVVRVFLKKGDIYEELKAGRFHIAPVETNAVIFANDSVPQGWVESWAFTFAQKDADTLIVEYSRIVENRSVPIDDPLRNFGTRGTGVFKRVAP